MLKKRIKQMRHNTCQACGSKDNLTIDHDHNTGLVRDVLCVECNGAVGHIENNHVTERLLRKLQKEGRLQPVLLYMRKYEIPTNNISYNTHISEVSIKKENAWRCVTNCAICKTYKQLSVDKRVGGEYMCTACKSRMVQLMKEPQTTQANYAYNKSVQKIGQTGLLKKTLEYLQKYDKLPAHLVVDGKQLHIKRSANPYTDVYTLTCG